MSILTGRISGLIRKDVRKEYKKAGKEKEFWFDTKAVELQNHRESEMAEFLYELYKKEKLNASNS